MLQDGQQLGEFEILKELGRGGMGAVFMARQTVLRRLVAIKTLQPSLACDAEFVTRFHNEAVAAAGLNHPNLVQVYAAGHTDARAGVKADGSCRFESGGPPEDGAGAFARRRTPMDAPRRLYFRRGPR